MTDSKILDESDVVIRFNNYATRERISHTQNPYKCDILFSTFDLHSHGAKPNDVIIGIPFPFKAKEVSKKPDKWYPSSRHWMVDPYQNMKMCEELDIDSLGASHPLPSLGFTALWHMKNWDAEFYICGFSWYYSEEKKKIQGWDMRREDYCTHWNHNYPKEIRWIIKNLLPKDNIIFSYECMRILDTISKIIKK